MKIEREKGKIEERGWRGMEIYKAIPIQISKGKTEERREKLIRRVIMMGRG